LFAVSPIGYSNNEEGIALPHPFPRIVQDLQGKILDNQSFVEFFESEQREKLLSSS
jgi:hypothetical protein